MSETIRVPIAPHLHPPHAPAGTSPLAGATAKARALADSEMAAAISGFDWGATALGSAEAWPHSLKSTVRLLLGSRYPGFVLWGKDLVALYNDAYADVLGARHPWALGRSFRETWGEIWDVVGPQFEAVMRDGASTWNDRVLLVMERRGYTEETYFTFSYSPCFDDQGEVGGVFCTCTEETGRVLGERRLQSLRMLATATRDSRSPAHACERAAEALASNPHDVPFALFYLQEGDVARLVAGSGADEQPLLAPQAIALQDGAPWFLAEVAAARQPRHVTAVHRIATVAAGPWPEPVRDALVLPLPAPSTGAPAGFLVAGLNPRRPLDAEYDDYLALVAQQVAGAIADARSHEEQRQQAQALAEIDRAKTLFFSNVSHELRTPLALMLGPVADLLEDGALEPAARHALVLAQRNGRRLQRLVNTLLDFSRIEAGRMEARFQPVDLAAFTAELASFFDSAASKAGLELQIDCPPLPQPVYVDRSMWEKIVFNLLSKAIKYTPAGSVCVRLRASGDGVLLEISDTGHGIPQAALPHVFERFYRVEGAHGRSIEGTGIGLALVAELARIHGAQPRVESWLGAGSTFSIALPFGHAHLPPEQIDDGAADHGMTAAQSGWLDEMEAWFTSDSADDGTRAPSLAGEPVSPWGAAAPSQRGSVLLVDDNADMRGYLARLLGREHDVRTAADGWQALQRIAERVPDLVLTDMMMGRMDGFALLERLRADPATATLPVVMLSANAAEDVRVRALAAGADDVLLKPFHARELLARVSGTLRLAQVRRDAMQREQQVRAEVEQMLESIAEGFVAVDTDWRFTYVNASAERIYGRGRESLLGRRLWDVFPELGESAFSGPFRRAMHERVPLKAEAPYDPLGGWFEVSIFPVASGGLSLYFRDVLQNRLMHRALRESEEQQRFLSNFGEVVQRIGEPAAVLDAAVDALARHLHADRCIWALCDEDAGLAWVRGEFRDEGMCSRLGALQLRDFPAEHLRLLRAGQTFVLRDAEFDSRLGVHREHYRNTQIGAALSAGVLRGSRLVAAIAVHQRGPRDWTDSEIQLVQSMATRCWEAFERAQVQQAQRESEQRFREMADSMPQIVYVTDAQGGIEYVNRQWHAYTGRAEAAFADVEAATHPDDRAVLWGHWQEAFASGQPLVVEFRLRGRDGHHRWFLTRAVPTHDAQGQVQRWYGTSTDIDDSRRNAEALAQAHAALQQAERRKDQFIATLAHELRNPLAPLRNGVQLLALGGGPDGGARVQGMMKRQIDQLVRLVDDLLEVSRITSGKVALQRSRLDLAELLASVAESSRAVVETARHSLHVDVDALGGQLVDGDALRLGQVFANLLNNAAKYTEPGGHISLRGWCQDGQAVVQVQDNGLGLAADMLQEVFQPFVQVDRSASRAQGGLGIGLSIVRSLVDLHGGSVVARSEGPGRGSTFEVRLPVAAGPAQPEAGADPARQRQPVPVGPAVLVVDDNHDAADSLAYMLEMMGAAIRVVYGGPDALAAIDADVPALVLLDIGMPGMDGYEVARRLAEHPQRHRMLLVALTGWGQSEDRQRTREAGFDDHLVKPADIDVLEVLLARARRDR